MRIFLTVLLLVSAAFVPLSAHPHVFVDLSVAYDSDRNRLRVVWEMDEMSSNLIAMDYDRDRNGRFDAEECRAFLGVEGYAALFRRGGFFLHPETPVENLQVQYEKGRVRVLFETTPCSDSLGIWDEEYMFAFQLVERLNIRSAGESDDFYGYELELR